MSPVKRIGVVLSCCMFILMGLAYAGVRFAEKPVAWMPAALSVCLLILIIGFAWAYYPMFLGIESAPKRYIIKTTLTIISIMVAAFFGYVFFANMWLFFGGQI